MNELKGYEKKQCLIKTYFDKINELKHERGKVNAELKICQQKFEDLINTEADVEQLRLFENIDQYLNN